MRSREYISLLSKNETRSSIYAILCKTKMAEKQLIVSLFVFVNFCLFIALFIKFFILFVLVFFRMFCSKFVIFNVKRER
jgi:hypothetical protein